MADLAAPPRRFQPAPPALLDFVRALARSLARQHHAASERPESQQPEDADAA